MIIAYNFQVFSWLSNLPSVIFDDCFGLTVQYTLPPPPDHTAFEPLSSCDTIRVYVINTN
jgi:hypothetical protein